MSEFGERVKGLGKKGIQAAVPAVMFLGSVLPGVKVGEARQVSDVVSDSPDGHNFYIENPSLVEQAIENARLNIPSLVDLQVVPTPETGTNCRIGSPEQWYPLCLRLTDHLNRQRFLGVENISLDSIGPIGGVDDWINNNYVQTYLLNRDYYGTGRPAIAAIGLHPAKQLLFLGASEEVQSGVFFNRGGELVNIQQAPDKTRNIKVTSEGINFQSGSWLSVPFITEGSNYYWEFNFTRAVNTADNGRYRINADSAGNIAGTRWLRVIDATATPTILPTRTPILIATATPTPGDIVRASGFTMSTVPEIIWRDGSMETDYLVLRLGSRGAEVATLLPQNATSFMDRSPSALSPCYIVFARRLEQIIGNSDPYCLINGIKTLTQPEGFSVGLNGNNATVGLRRSSLFPFDAYAVIAFGASGVRSIPVPGNTESVTDNTGGQPTGYILAGVRAGSFYLTDGIFAIPGFAR